jgi:hypothetical protein
MSLLWRLALFALLVGWWLTGGVRYVKWSGSAKGETNPDWALLTVSLRNPALIRRDVQLLYPDGTGKVRPRHAVVVL